MSALEQVSDQIENIPGFGLASTAYEEFAPDYLKSRDPFYVKVDGDKKRRKAPVGATEGQKKGWKRVMKKAWQYDRNFCCGGCIGFDIGLGIIPIINILPVIGPILAYTLQGSLIRECGGAGAPLSVQAKMTANCGTDFLISLCPVLGVLFCWMFGCATRNAAIFDLWLDKTVAKGPRVPGPHSQGVPHRATMPWNQQQQNQQRKSQAAGASPKATAPTARSPAKSPTRPPTASTRATPASPTSAPAPKSSQHPPSYQAPYAPGVQKPRTSVAQYAPQQQPQSPASPSRNRPKPVDL